MSPSSSLLTLLVGGLWSWLIIAFAIGYLLGSIPFGLVLTKLAGIGDVRKQGSGNIGATNVLRTGKKGLAFGTLLLDGLKGTIAVLLVDHFYGQGAALFAGAGAFLGHVFPIWLKFRGGKGVATLVGIIAAFDWKVGLVFAAAWIAVALVSRYSSLAGILASIAVPVTFYLTDQNAYAIVSAALAIILIGKHYSNIIRLIRGTEAKIGART